jgi:hypothetical protein
MSATPDEPRRELALLAAAYMQALQTLAGDAADVVALAGWFLDAYDTICAGGRFVDSPVLPTTGSLQGDTYATVSNRTSNQ